jgi:hypothetical protein
MIRYVLFVCILSSVGLAWASDAIAIPTSVACSDCTRSGREAAAIGQGLGEHYVHNWTNGQLYKYGVGREPMGQGNYLWFATPLPVEQDLQDYILVLKAFHDENNGWSASETVQAPNQAGNQDNAYDAINVTSPAHYRTLQHLMDESTIADFHQGVRGVLGSVRVINTGVSPVTIVTVEFSDGSSMKFRWNMETRQFEYLEDSSRDSHGNRIPDTEEDLTGNETGIGTYDFTGSGNPGDLSDFTQRIGLWNVTIVSGAYSFACTISPAGSHCAPF